MQNHHLVFIVLVLASTLVATAHAEDSSRIFEVAWGPKEIRLLDELAESKKEGLLQMSPAEIKKWLTLDEHERYSYEQLKILSLDFKMFTKEQWQSIFGSPEFDGTRSTITWNGVRNFSRNGLVQYIVPWTGRPQDLVAALGPQETVLYRLVVP